MAHSENCNIVADAIERSDSYDQECYSHSCGTPACVAGHTVMVLDKEFIKFGTGTNGIHYCRGDRDNPKWLPIADGAGQLLELTKCEAGSLFSAFPLRGKIVTQRIAAKVLRLLATDDVVRWERFQ